MYAADGLTLYTDIHGKNAAVDWVTAYWQLCELAHPSATPCCFFWRWGHVVPVRVCATLFQNSNVSDLTRLGLSIA